MNPKKYKIAIYGAGGLTGRELLGILKNHPAVEIGFISSNLYAGKQVSSVFPELAAYNQPWSKKDLLFSKHDAPLPSDTDLVFLAVPNETSLKIVPELIEKNIKCIDLSGSFRLHDQIIWEKYYKLEHTAFSSMDQMVFGLPELFREKIKTARFISNPGCYPTGPIIALDALSKHTAEIENIVIDAKSGVSGAGGRTEDAGFRYNDIHENFRAYKILEHQHQPEILEYAFHRSKTTYSGKLVFTPHLLPIQRGILSTIVIQWKKTTPPNIKKDIENHCHQEKFIRFYSEPEQIDLQKIAHTNFVDLAVKSDPHNSIIITAIDNLIKGAAGQAIQNMNLMLGLPEEMALI